MHQLFEPLRIINPIAKSIHSLLNGLEELACALFSLADYETIFDYILFYSEIEEYSIEILSSAGNLYIQAIRRFRELTEFLMNRTIVLDAMETIAQLSKSNSACDKTKRIGCRLEIDLGLCY